MKSEAEAQPPARPFPSAEGGGERSRPRQPLRSTVRGEVSKGGRREKRAKSDPLEPPSPAWTATHIPAQLRGSPQCGFAGALRPPGAGPAAAEASPRPLTARAGWGSPRARPARLASRPAATCAPLAPRRRFAPRADSPRRRPRPRLHPHPTRLAKSPRAASPPAPPPAARSPPRRQITG